MRVRAGIVYQMITDRMEPKNYREIIFWSGWADNIKFYFDIYNINKIIESEIRYATPKDFQLQQFFGNRSGQLMKIFEDYEDECILGAVSYYLFEYVYAIIDQLKIITLQNPTYGWYSTLGLNMESSAKIILTQIYGYDIIEIDRAEVTISKSIMLVGKADGLIKSSPGGLYDGWILEIKFSKGGNCNILKNQSQIACYHKIYDRPVLLVIYTLKQLKIYPYNSAKLGQIWDSTINDKLIAECKKIKKISNVEKIQDIPKLMELILP